LKTKEEEKLMFSRAIRGKGRLRGRKGLVRTLQVGRLRGETQTGETEGKGMSEKETPRIEKPGDGALPGLQHDDGTLAEKPVWKGRKCG